MNKKIKILAIFCIIFISQSYLYSINPMEHEMDKNRILAHIDHLKQQREETDSSADKARLDERINKYYDRIEYLNNNGNKSSEEIFKDKASDYKTAKEEYDKFKAENPMTEENSKTVSDDFSDYKVYNDPEIEKKYNELAKKLYTSKNEAAKAKKDYLVESEGGYTTNHGVPLSKKEVDEFEKSGVNQNDINANLKYGDNLLYDNAEQMEEGSYTITPPTQNNNTNNNTPSFPTPSEEETTATGGLPTSNTIPNNPIGTSINNAISSSNFGQKMFEYSTESRENIKNTIASATWIVALFFFAFSLYPVNQYFAYFKREHGVKQNGQVNAPRITMIMHLSWIYFATTFVLYLYLGLVGTIWTNKSFSEMWAHFIQEPIAYLLGF